MYKIKQDVLRIISVFLHLPSFPSASQLLLSTPISHIPVHSAFTMYHPKSLALAPLKHYLMLTEGHQMNIDFLLVIPEFL